MIALTGQVLNVFKTPEGTNKEGEKYGGAWKVQVQGTTKLKNGEERVELHTLSCDEPEPFRAAKGKEILVPVGAFSPGKGQIMFYITGVPQLIGGRAS